MAAYETQPRSINAIQFTDSNLADVLVFTRFRVQIPKLFSDFRSYAEYAYKVNTFHLLSEYIISDSRTRFQVGDFIVAHPSGMYEVIPQDKFALYYREVSST